MEGGDGRPPLENDKVKQVFREELVNTMQVLGLNLSEMYVGKIWAQPRGPRCSQAVAKALGLPGRIRAQRRECLTNGDEAETDSAFKTKGCARVGRKKTEVETTDSRDREDGDYGNEPGRDEPELARRCDQTFDLFQAGPRSCFSCDRT